MASSHFQGRLDPSGVLTNGSGRNFDADEGDVDSRKPMHAERELLFQCC
jgi:hypothetical protein